MNILPVFEAEKLSELDSGTLLLCAVLESGNGVAVATG